MLCEGLERYATALGLGFVALGGWLRFQGLGEWALNPDEGIYAAVAGARSWDIFVGGVREAAHPPFYFVLLWALGGAADPVALRLPAALFGTLGVWGVFLLTRVALGPATAVLAAGAFALAPGAIEVSQLVRPYALQCALLAFGWWGLLGALRGAGGRAGLVIYGGAFGLALFTHYGSALPLAATIGWLALGAVTERVGRPLWRPLLGVHTALLGLGGLLGALHFYPYLLNANTFSNMDWLAPFLQESLGGVWLSFVGVQRYVFGLAYDGAATVLVMVGFVAAWRGAAPAGGLPAERPQAGLPPGGLAGLAAVALGLAALLGWAGLYPFGGTRHAAYLSVLLVPLGAAGVRGLLAGRGWRLAAGAAALAVCLVVPGVPAVVVGAPHLAFGPQVERLATPAQLQALPFAGLRSQPALILLDEQAFYFLQPFFREARRLPDAIARGDEPPPWRRYAWGQAELAVSRRWTLRTGPRAPDAPDHYAGLLDRVRRAGPVPAERPVWLVSGGWAPLAANAVAASGRGSEPFVRPYAAGVRLAPSAGSPRRRP